jgi:N-acetylneuraminate synthase
VKKLTHTEIKNRKTPYLIAEIGINHNGDLNIAKRLIDVAKTAGFDAVKFQKRTIEMVYSAEELAAERDSVFGKTNGDLKRGLEFGRSEYEQIDRYCRNLEIAWSASPWDIKSIEFLEEFDLPFYKVASASLTDSVLLETLRKTNRPIILSTGMSTLKQVTSAVSLLDKDTLFLMHTNSTYPAKSEELNLSVITLLREKFNVPVGYSGHESGVLPSVIAYSKFGADLIERHITLDRAMWGSDQAASLEPQGVSRLVQYLKEASVVDGVPKKELLESEIPVMKKLRKVSDY